MGPVGKSSCGRIGFGNRAWKAVHVRALVDGALPFGKRLRIGRDARGLQRRKTLLVWVD